MKDEDKSREQLIEELVSLRNKLNNLKFEVAQREHKDAAKQEEESQLQLIREYAAWVIYAAPFVICQLTLDGTTRFINPFSEKITGYKANELIGKNWWKVLFSGEEFHRVGKLLRTFDKEGDVLDYEMALVTKGGQKRTFAFTSLNRYDEGGKLKEIVLIGNDVSARKRVEEQLERSETKFRTLTQNIPCAVYRYGNDKALTALYMSDYIEQIVGHSSWDFIENKVLSYIDLIHPEDREKVINQINEAVARRRLYMLEYRIYHENGGLRWVHDKGQGYYDKEGKLKWLDGAIFDITDRKEMEEKIRALSLRDELTKLYNRRGFITHAEQHLAIAERKNRPLSIIFIDLNKMKQINDKLGHKMGDEALIRTAAVLNDTFRKADVIARLGGDEFAVLAVETDGEHARIMCKRLYETIDKYNAEPDKPFDLSMSTGISSYTPGDKADIEKLLEHADEKMYEMKRSTR